MNCPICTSDNIKVVLTLKSPLGGVWDILPVLQSLPLFGHNYSYYKKIS